MFFAVGSQNVLYSEMPSMIAPIMDIDMTNTSVLGASMALLLAFWSV